MPPTEIHGPHGFESSSFSVLPFVGSFLLLITLAAVISALVLWRKGRLPPAAFGGRRSPEDDAKRILAERFANGTITTEEFMERSSILNWTPGSDSLPSKSRTKRS